MKKILLLAFLLFPSLSYANYNYYVATTGSNSNSCSDALYLASPKLTIASALPCLCAGDTLTIESGTYAESIASTAIPAGTSSSIITTIKGDTGATVIIRPSSANATGDAVTVYDRDYITFDNITIDGTNATRYALAVGGVSTFAHHVTFKNGVIQNTPSNSCFGAPGNASNVDIQILHSVVTSCGTSLASTVSDGINWPISTGIIEDTEVKLAHGIGIRNYVASGAGAGGNIIRKNYVHDNYSYGIMTGSGTGNLVYQNIVTNNGTFDSNGGLYVYNASTSAKLVNNTVYNNPGFGIFIDSNGNSSTLVRNNIFYLNIAGTISDSGTGSTKDHNFTTNPNFVSTSGKNFQLTPASGAIDQGLTLSPCPTGMDCALNGTAPDCGAFEYQQNNAHPTMQSPFSIQVQ